MIPEHDKPWLDASGVAENVVVKLTFSTGDERSMYVGRSDEGLGVSWISSDSEGGRRLLGRRKNDTVDWGSDVSGSQVTVTIADVVKPEVYAAQSAIETAPLLFAGTSPIAKLTIGDDAAELKEHLRKASEKTEGAIAFAKSRDLPFGTLVRLFGRDAFTTWGVVAGTGLTIFSNQNTLQEVADESADLGRARAIVVDTLTLLTLGLVDGFARLRKRFDHILVPQRSYDELHESRERVQEGLARGGTQSVHYEGGQVVGTRTPPEALSSQSQFLGKILAFCEQECERVGEPRAYSSFERKEMAEVLGPAFLDAVAVAEARGGDGVALYSDDAMVRVVARQHYRAMTFSTNTTLIADRKAGTIDEAAHADAMRLLLNLGYRRLTISVPLLDYLVLAMRSPVDYAAVVEELFRPGSDRDVTLRVIANHLRDVVVGSPVWELVLKYLDVLLPKVYSAYGNAGIRALRRAVPVKERLIIIPNESRLDALLKQWENAAK